MVLRVDKEKGYIDLSKRCAMTEGTPMCRTLASIRALSDSSRACSAGSPGTVEVSEMLARFNAAFAVPASCMRATYDRHVRERPAARGSAAHGSRCRLLCGLCTETPGLEHVCAGERRRVQPEDISKCEERYTKSKLVHSIMRHVAETQGVDLVELYSLVAWPLFRLYGHAHDAFKLMVISPDELWAALEADAAAADPPRDVSLLSEGVRAAIMTNIRRRLTPQPLKIRADLEMTCFQYGGVEHIKVCATMILWSMSELVRLD